MQLERILSGIAPLAERPPIAQWAPELSGDMDLVIQRDGQWVHEGTAFSRYELVQLFARILRREADGDHYLVTPVEKWRIRVEDCAFLVVAAEFKGGAWILTTNVGEQVTLGAEHQLSVTPTPAGEWVPEVDLPHGVAARLGRNVFYQLAEQGEVRHQPDGNWLGLESDGHWQPLGRVDEGQECS
ncbi:DUF1285 domain-containing protein [Halomonas huangheensis]|uniref:Proteophosphoglycan n=1 Tax=Halomonas huangheensis TaxID=1178482 RepID=W1N2K5_9GAMM|nr:DUF1285 domain-containing protein [Halomonas huangheensis]ALM52180.1 hypothetical protein AR456_07700 [Halomonas huangheensis]ERL49396.1 hypothetical protein BJB45_06350 [Halomonas huangheensis]